MKTCPDCGLKTDDRFMYCPEDGAALKYAGKTVRSTVPDETSPMPAPKVSLLFCPACEGEYPLTFSACPIDGLRLTREKIRFSKATLAPIKPASQDAASVSISPVSAAQLSPASEVETLDYASKEADSIYYDSPDETYSEIDAQNDNFISPTDNQTGLIEKLRSDRPSFQVAAIATMIGLGIFGSAALYSLYDYRSKRPSIQSPVETTQTGQEDPPSFFIETPREAREYVDEAAGSTIQSPQKRPGVVPEVQPSRERANRVQQPPVEKNGSRADTPPLVPRSLRERVEARLVRVRSSRTRPGYRYDLTFTLREQAGQPVRWDKLTVSARSTSGINHLQTLPFNHRLSPSGMLTFTVSVEMPGRGEQDWRGRIVCTTVGKDYTGRSLRASFGTNVSP